MANLILALMVSYIFSFARSQSNFDCDFEDELSKSSPNVTWAVGQLVDIKWHCDIPIIFLLLRSLHFSSYYETLIDYDNDTGGYFGYEVTEELLPYSPITITLQDPHMWRIYMSCVITVANSTRHSPLNSASLSDTSELWSGTSSYSYPQPTSSTFQMISGTSRLVGGSDRIGSSTQATSPPVSLPYSGLANYSTSSYLQDTSDNGTIGSETHENSDRHHRQLILGPCLGLGFLILLLGGFTWYRIRDRRRRLRDMAAQIETTKEPGPELHGRPQSELEARQIPSELDDTSISLVRPEDNVISGKKGNDL